MEERKSPEDLSHEDSARFILDMFHRIIMHHVLWYTEVRHQMGTEKALEILHTASRQSYEIQMQHLSKALGFEMKEGIPSPLLAMDKAALADLRDRVAKNWLANDGVWFQAVEKAEGMNEAKRCNDSCWAQFSQVEAASIRWLIGLPENSGLAGLKQALGFRVYGSINTQSIVDETPTSFVFCMNECRVQVARKRKGLADYPCKSAGMVEYSYFARAVDRRIRTECVACPPDSHPDEWYCAWKFILDEEPV